MKLGAISMAVLLCLAPLTAALTDPVVMAVTYLGHGQFTFEDKQYDYNGLVSALQTAYASKHFDALSVDMGSVISELDKGQVCTLRQSLQTRVHMFITVDGDKRIIYCN